jgi:hypothetical protein
MENPSETGYAKPNGQKFQFHEKQDTGLYFTARVGFRE